MRILPVCLLAVAALQAFGADARFNGRWVITGYAEPRNRAWWLEINGAETEQPKGRFVTAYGGDMNEIQTMTVGSGELR